MKQFAIIGCGQVAEKHAENIIRTGCLKAVCDIDYDKAVQYAEKYHASSYFSIDQLLAQETEVDTLVICSPNGYHAEHVIKSLQAGKDLLVESPLCLTKAAAWQIIETEKYCQKRLLMVGRPMYHSVLKEVKKILEQNELGRLFSFQLNCTSSIANDHTNGWKRKVFPGGGALYGFFGFYLEAMLWLFGEIENVKGFVSTPALNEGSDVEQMGSVAMVMQNGVLGSLAWSLNAFKNGDESTLTIVAEKALIKIGGDFLQNVHVTGTTDHARLLSSSFEESHNWKELYDHLAVALDKNETGIPNVFDGLRLVNTIEKIYKATS